MNTKQGSRVVTVATIWGVFIVCASLTGTVFLFFFHGAVPLNPGMVIPWNPFYQLGNTVLVALLVYGLHRRSVLCATGLIVNTVARALYLLAIGHPASSPFFSLASVALYSWAIFQIVTANEQETAEEEEGEAAGGGRDRSTELARCPHCGEPVALGAMGSDRRNEVRKRIKGRVEKEIMYFCPHCDRVLGFGNFLGGHVARGQ